MRNWALELTPRIPGYGAITYGTFCIPAAIFEDNVDLMKLLRKSQPLSREDQSPQTDNGQGQCPGTGLLLSLFIHLIFLF